MNMTESVIIVPGPTIILLCREHGCPQAWFWLTWLLHFPGLLVLMAISVLLLAGMYRTWRM